MRRMLKKAAKKFIEEVRRRYTITFKRKEVTVTPQSGIKNAFNCHAKNSSGVEAIGSVSFNSTLGDLVLVDVEQFNDPRSIFKPACDRENEEEEVI